jgi:mono/diheme cytochrome c family protein
LSSETQPAASAQNAGGAASFDQVMDKGKQIYTTTCQACHQATGAGLAGAFPPLAGSEWVGGPAKRMAAIVLHGIQGEITVKGEKFQSVMPPFKDQLKAEEIAAVLTFVRNSFGNKASPVTAEIVETVKTETKTKAGSWAGESELNSQKWE